MLLHSRMPIAQTLTLRSARKAQSPEAHAAQDLDRYADEELTRNEYELARLRRQRDAYVAMSADEPDPKELTTLAGKWRTGDAAQRREVLNALFERIHVRQDRKVEGYTPRMDRANRARVCQTGVKKLETVGYGALFGRVRSEKQTS